MPCRVRGGAAVAQAPETTRPGTWTGKGERMEDSYCDTRSVAVQLEVASMDGRQAEAVANAIFYSRDPAVTRAELSAALRKAAVAIIVINLILTAVLVKVLELRHADLWRVIWTCSIPTLDSVGEGSKLRK